MLLILYDIQDLYINTLCSSLDLYSINYTAFSQEKICLFEYDIISETSIVVKSDGHYFDLINDFKYLFCRRVNLYDSGFINKHGNIKITLQSEFHSMLEYVWNKVFDSLKRIWANPINLRMNRMSILERAKFHGLDTPNFIACMDKEKLRFFISTVESNLIVPKPFSEGVKFRFRGNDYFYLTTIMSTADIEKLPTKFPISLFMEYVPKKADIRVFYYNGKFYSTLLVSQDDRESKVDWRLGGDKIRNLSCQLPSKVENSLSNLLNELNMNNCSIDLLLDKNDIIYFLEINPEGQFGLHTYKCNYSIESEIIQVINSNEQI